jgi:DNA-3-methyladenine glycosylase
MPQAQRVVQPPFVHQLPHAFFARDPRRVARELLGRLLIRFQRRGWLCARIVEVEAYLGKNDPAAHAASGRTARNAVLFGPPGRAYVYFIYGRYHCFNVSCLPDGEAGCVLVRALEPLAGMAEMRANRNLPSTLAEKRWPLLTSGPGRLTQAFGITRAQDNGKDLTSPESDLQIADAGPRAGRVLITPRIGISKAAGKKLRYFMAGNPFVSG